MKSPLVAPSLLSADFGNLQRDLEMLNSSSADWFHVDVMDGIFVPNISFGFPVLKSIKKFSKKPLDVHLMIAHPENYLERFAEAGAANLTVHIENELDTEAAVTKIRSLGMKAGIAISPDTEVSALDKIISNVDMVILMSVRPGFGGQKFIPSTFQKLSDLKKLMKEKNSAALIEIDGGVDLDNVRELVMGGADILVAGNTVFGASDPTGTIAALKSISK